MSENGGEEDGSTPSQNPAEGMLESENSNNPEASSSPRQPSSASIILKTSNLGAIPSEGDEDVRRLKTDIYAIIQLKK